MSSKHFLRIQLSTFFALFLSVECASAKAPQYAPIVLDSIVIIVPFIPNKPNPISKGLLKKTGQTKSYDQVGDEVRDGSIKDDGYYKKGVTPRYSRVNEVVIDHVTGLQWQDDANVSEIKRSWIGAQHYCTIKGTGWRLPTRKELIGLRDYGRAKVPIINSIFLNTIVDGYCSSTIYAEDGWHWNVSFGNRVGQYFGSNSSLNYVRCVR